MDKQKSIYLKTANFINDDTLFQVAMCKINGIGMEKDEDEGFEILKILAARGFTPAIKPLSEQLKKRGKIEEAEKWLKYGASNGDVSSKIDLYMRDAMKEEQVTNVALNVENSKQGLQTVVKYALPHVVMIVVSGNKKGYCSTGSGFILDGGLVITNAHVLGNNPKNVVAMFEPSIDDKKYELEPIAVSEKYDLASLRFKGLFGEKMAKTEHLKIRTGELGIGEEVFTLGSPLGMGLSVTHGIVSNAHCTEEYKGLPYTIQTDMCINHGNSGGALFDLNGKVVGVATYVIKTGLGGLSFASPTTCLVEFLNNNKN